MKKMDFSKALLILKNGGKVQREGWNGKGMYIYLSSDLQLSSFKSLPLDPAIIMATAQKTHQPGWLSSQADLLAEDWIEVI
jgi:hypothetical protein